MTLSVTKSREIRFARDRQRPNRCRPQKEEREQARAPKVDEYDQGVLP